MYSQNEEHREKSTKGIWRWVGTDLTDHSVPQSSTRRGLMGVLPCNRMLWTMMEGLEQSGLSPSGDWMAWREEVGEGPP